MKRIFLLAAVLCLLAPGLAVADVGISVAQSSIDFGQVEIGQSRTLQVEVSSTGTDILEVNQVQFSLDNVQISPSYPGLLVGNLGRWFFMNSDFSNASISIPPGESRLIEFTFTPTSVGTVTGTLFIDGNFGGALPMVSYTGEGVAATYTLSPTTFNLGTLHSGDSVTRQYTVTNTSTTTPLHVSGYSYILSDFSGAGNLTSTDFPAWNYGSGFSAFRSDFSSYTIAPGGQQTFSFTYFATSVGSQSGTIELNTDGSAVGSNLISFTVVVQDPSFTPATYTLGPTAINYGTLNPGQSAVGQFTVRNTSTTAPLHVFAIVVSSLDFNSFTSADFSAINSDVALYRPDFSDYIIAPGGQQVFSIAFHAITLGSKSGIIMLSVDGTASGPDVISFTANVVAPPPPVASVPPPPLPIPEKPGISFFNDSPTVTSDSAAVAFHLTWKVFVLDMGAVRWDFGDGKTGSGKDILHRFRNGTYTVKVTARSVDDSTYTASQTQTFGPMPLAVSEPATPGGAPPEKQYKTGLVGSRMVKATNKAGGGKNKRPPKPKAGKVVAVQAAPGGAPASWGEIKQEMSQEQ